MWGSPVSRRSIGNTGRKGCAVSEPLRVQSGSARRYRDYAMLEDRPGQREGIYARLFWPLSFTLTGKPATRVRKYTKQGIYSDDRSRAHYLDRQLAKIRGPCGAIKKVSLSFKTKCVPPYSLNTSEFLS